MKGRLAKKEKVKKRREKRVSEKIEKIHFFLNRNVAFEKRTGYNGVAVV